VVRDWSLLFWKGSRGASLMRILSHAAQIQSVQIGMKVLAPQKIVPGTPVFFLVPDSKGGGSRSRRRRARFQSAGVRSSKFPLLRVVKRGPQSASNLLKKTKETSHSVFGHRPAAARAGAVGLIRRTKRGVLKNKNGNSSPGPIPSALADGREVTARRIRRRPR